MQRYPLHALCVAAACWTAMAPRAVDAQTTVPAQPAAAGPSLPPARSTAEELRALGRVIAPQATARLYAPKVQEREPYHDVQVERDIPYGAADRHRLDIFTLPHASARNWPVLVFVHGGGFTAGNRQVSPDSPFYDNIGLWAVRNGVVGVNITYRLAPQDAWPAGGEDIGQALRWVERNIAARGGDPRRVFLFGHSSGATHVAAHLATRPQEPAAAPALAGAFLLSGLYRITADAKLPPNLTAYFGTDTARYEERSPFAGVLRTQTPLWLGVAELDTPVTEAQTQALHDGLCAAGRCPAFVRFADHNHMSVAYSIGSRDRAVGDALLRFMWSRAP